MNIIQSKHPTVAYYILVIIFAAIAGCVGISHWIFGTWGVM